MKEESSLYRLELSNRLRDLRQSGNVAGARQVLSEERSLEKRDSGDLHSYLLAQVLKRDKSHRDLFRSHKYDEPSSAFRGGDFITSNEPSLFEVFPYLQHCKGALIAVGSDQALDFAVNTNCARIVALDSSPAVSATTRAFLEIGRRHHELFKKYPTPDEFIAYVSPKNVRWTIEMLASQFFRDDIRHIESNIESNKLKQYLSLKSKQSAYRSWVTDEASLARIVSMYENGRLIPIRGDLEGRHSLKSISLQFEKDGIPIDVIYLSNAINNRAWYRNMRTTMHVHDDTIIICTDLPRDFRGMQIPEYVDSYDGEEMFIKWHMDVRTVKDRMNNDSLYEREQRIANGNVRPEDVGLRIPKSGFVVSSDIPESSATVDA
ncbi:MAG: hypothetical protein AAB798_02615 [Patescibacteria group bacterium]